MPPDSPADKTIARLQEEMAEFRTAINNGSSVPDNKWHDLLLRVNIEMLDRTEHLAKTRVSQEAHDDLVKKVDHIRDPLIRDIHIRLAEIDKILVVKKTTEDLAVKHDAEKKEEARDRLDLYKTIIGWVSAVIVAIVLCLTWFFTRVPVVTDSGHTTLQTAAPQPNKP